MSLIYPVYHWEEALYRLKQRVSSLIKKKNDWSQSSLRLGTHQLEGIVRRSFTRSARLVVRVLPEGR